MEELYQNLEEVEAILHFRVRNFYRPPDNFLVVTIQTYLVDLAPHLGYYPPPGYWLLQVHKEHIQHPLIQAALHQDQDQRKPGEVVVILEAEHPLEDAPVLLVTDLFLIEAPVIWKQPITQ